MKNLKNKDDLVNFNIFKLIVKNSLHLVWIPCISQNPCFLKQILSTIIYFYSLELLQFNIQIY